MTAIKYFRGQQLLLGSIPFRRDISFSHPINENIIRFNLHLFEQSQIYQHVTFLDLTQLGDRCHDRAGVLTIKGNDL